MNEVKKTLSDNSILSIRFASKNDIPAILQFIRDLAEFEKLSDEVIATTESLEATLFGNTKYAEVIIGERNGEAITFALFFHNYSTFLAKPGLYLEDLFVKPDYRSLGIGKHMLAFLARTAIDRGCGRFEWSVLDWNTRAIDFYKSLGAIPLSDWTVYRMTGNSLANLAKL